MCSSDLYIIIARLFERSEEKELQQSSVLEGRDIKCAAETDWRRLHSGREGVRLEAPGPGGARRGQGESDAGDGGGWRWT